MRIEYIEQPLELQDATVVEQMRGVLDNDEGYQQRKQRLEARRREYAQTDETKGKAYAAGRREAEVASQATGIDFLARYEAMCRALWGMCTE